MVSIFPFTNVTLVTEMLCIIHQSLCRYNSSMLVRLSRRTVYTEPEIYLYGCASTAAQLNNEK